jgi:hypothetical protein
VREVYFANARLAARVAARPAGYLAELEACVTRRDAGGVWVDQESPAWRRMVERYAPARAAEVRARLATYHALWAEFHRRPLEISDEDLAGEPAWLEGFATRVPQAGCGCSGRWRELVKAVPPDLSSRLAYARWGWGRHNAVSEGLGKEPMPWLAAVRTHHWGELIGGPSTAGRSTIEAR